MKTPLFIKNKMEKLLEERKFISKMIEEYTKQWVEKQEEIIALQEYIEGKENGK